MSSWRGRKVLVTGAAGFIGSHLVERLVELGTDTRALVRYTSSGSRGWLDASGTGEHVEVFAADICDGTVVERAIDGVDTVFHLAALIGIPYSYVAPPSYVRTNVEGTLTVLEAARRAGVRRVVHTSTSEVYGTARSVPMREDHPLQTQSPYAATKASADLLATAYHRTFGLGVTIVRPFNTYGPRQSNRAVIPTIITQALSGTEIKLGHLDPTRDFTYIDDTVDGFLRAGLADGVAGETFNLGSGAEISIAQLAAKVQQILGTRLPVVSETSRVRPDTSEVERLYADASRAASMLGWRPRVSLDDGLTRTIAWVKDHLDRYRVDVYGI